MLNVNDFASNPNGTLDSIFHLIPLLAAESYLTAFDSVQRSHQERAFLTLSTPHQPSVRRAASPWEPIGRCPRRHRMSLGMSLLWHCTSPPQALTPPCARPQVNMEVTTREDQKSNTCIPRYNKPTCLNPLLLPRPPQGNHIPSRFQSHGACSPSWPFPMASTWFPSWKISPCDADALDA